MSYDAIAEDVRHFILERGDSAIVVGHSLGGRATMAAALKHPGAVAAAMVVDMSPSNFASGVDSAAARCNFAALHWRCCAAWWATLTAGCPGAPLRVVPLCRPPLASNM